VTADGGVTYQDIAQDADSGLAYHRVPNPAQLAVLEDTRAINPIDLETFDFGEFPPFPKGVPGTALFDFDGDGDLDIYVTNGPDADNSLFSNQLTETGQLSFVDVGVTAGVAARVQDSIGTCAGDIDNDGDLDLMVVGSDGPSILYENQGNGTFRDITATAGVGGGTTTSTGCALGDVNGDGLLDVYVSNAWNNWTHVRYGTDPFTWSEVDELYINQGGNVFEDVSETSGIRDIVSGIPAEVTNRATVTWVASLVDYDFDGDLDLITATDQSGLPPVRGGGFNLGQVRFFDNDGTGHFTEVSDERGLSGAVGFWMGLSFGDFDCNGKIDIFSTNVGDYLRVVIPSRYEFPELASRPFFGQLDGSYTDPGNGPGVVTSAFGWGTSVLDYDNDADPDILYHGGAFFVDVVDETNAGILLLNRGCTGDFTRDFDAFANSADHGSRSVMSVAAGDLNNDGFEDIVTAAGFKLPSDLPFRFPPPVDFGGVLTDAQFAATLGPDPDTPGQFIWFDVPFLDGDLAVEINSADNGNHWVHVDLVGTVGLTTGGRSNRDGIGAVVHALPVGQGKWMMQPVVAGSSFAAQDSLTAHFGLGNAARTHLEVQWPGGHRNALYNVKANSRVRLPEIPCDIADPDASILDHLFCNLNALDELEAAGLVTPENSRGFLISQMRGFLRYH
jgi:hypothetical protein